MVTNPKQRADLYDDLILLIDPGFLSRSITIDGHTYWFRTFGEGDRFLLRARTASGDRECWTIATALWMIDGHNILGNEEAIHVAFEHFRSLPLHVVNQIYSVVLGLFHRARNAEDGVLSFCYEASSRAMWRASLQGANLTRPVPGIADMGLSRARQTWVCYNHMEDLREQSEGAWDQFLVVAGVQNPKGVEKIRRAMDASESRLMETRQQEQDLYFMYRMGMISREAWLRQGTVKQVGIGSKSVDQLHEELNRWVAGEKDEHDIIIENYRLGVLQRKEELEVARKEAAARLAQEAAEREEAALKSGFNPTPLVGYTPEQLDMILSQRHQRQIYDDAPAYSSFERFAKSEEALAPKMGPR